MPQSSKPVYQSLRHDSDTDASSSKEWVGSQSVEDEVLSTSLEPTPLNHSFRWAGLSLAILAFLNVILLALNISNLKNVESQYNSSNISDTRYNRPHRNIDLKKTSSYCKFVHASTPPTI
jgi:hypothetical protein